MKVAGYEILNEVGRGGMGVVFRVRTPDGRDAALKILAHSDPAIFARFERERRLLESLGEDEGFVALIDAGRTKEGAWLVMPYMAGGTLRARLQHGPLDVDDALALGIDLASALGHAHAKGIVHRDVKPENILFTSEGRPLVADLGLAKHFDRSATGGSQSLSLTASGVARGTAGYMSPEQFEDAKSVGPACDVFALGAVLYECLGGRPAFPGDSALEILAKVSSGVVEALERPDVPAWLERVLFKALSRDPKKRFPDGASLAQALREGGAKRSRRGPVLAASALTLVAAAVVFFPKKAPAPPNKEEPAPVASAAAPLPRGLRLAGRMVPAADGKEVPLYEYRLPDGTFMEMVSVPAGPFPMGASGKLSSPSEVPLHQHAIPRPYWIGRNDVTWAEFLACCQATLRPEPLRPRWWDKLEGNKNLHPVVTVSWEEAAFFATWAELALPTEAEWEKAARGTDKRKFPWGNEWDPGKRCNYLDASCPLDTIGDEKGKLLDVYKKNGITWDHEHDDGFPYTSPVGSFPLGVSPCGALDMVGNVYQWCEEYYEEDAYERYASGDYSPPPEGPERAVRGGCWNFEARGCRTAFRVGFDPKPRYDTVGFRVVLRSP